MGIVLPVLRDTITTLASSVSILKSLFIEFDPVLQRALRSPGLTDPRLTEIQWLNDPPFPECVNMSSVNLTKTANVAIIGSGIAGSAFARSILYERRPPQYRYGRRSCWFRSSAAA
jgi:hypothetical protein